MLTTDNVVRFMPKPGHTPISATPQASAMIERIVRKHGPVAIYQSGGCCDGSLPLCLLADDLGRGPNDVLLGDLDGVPFYIDAEQYERWREPEFLLDVAAGAPEGFSLGLPTRTSLPGRCPARPAHCGPRSQPTRRWSARA